MIITDVLSSFYNFFSLYNSFYSLVVVVVFVEVVVVAGSLFLVVLVVVTLLRLYYYKHPMESLLVLYTKSYLIHNDRIFVWK